MGMGERLIGVDVGGTKVSVAVLEDGVLSDPVLRPTEQSSSEALGELLAQRDALQRDVDRRPRGACCEVDDARDADPDRVGRSGLLDRGGELLDERVA